jgi:hypothetical protein
MDRVRQVTKTSREGSFPDAGHNGLRKVGHHYISLGYDTRCSCPIARDGWPSMCSRRRQILADAVAFTDSSGRIVGYPYRGPGTGGLVVTVLRVARDTGLGYFLIG